MRYITSIASVLACALLAPLGARADQLPTGYLVWSKGKAGDPASRKIYRVTLPGKTDEMALTGGEDVECQISPDGKWVAYAKAKIAASDYHSFKLWKLYIVSIHGASGGRKEIKIDDDGAWPSWGKNGELYYNQPDGTHTRIVKVTLDSSGKVTQKEVFFETKTAFGGFQEVTESFVSPDGSWFAGRTRGSASINGVGAYQISPPKYFMLARAGSIGCMPYVAPGGEWGLIAGSDQGIRWGHAPHVQDRKEDQQLIPPKSSSHKAYHPGVSTDGKWVMTGFGTEQDHNSGAYDIYIYPLDESTMTVGTAVELAAGGFNGWPHVWVGTPTPPPPPEPTIVEFYPSSWTVAPGEKVTLTWSTQDAETVELDGTSVETDGTSEVTPASTTTYTLVAKNSKTTNTDTKGCKVTVNATPQAVSIVSFTATPGSIERGQSATLTWEVHNPTTLDIDGERIEPEGELEVSPTETTTYKLTAQGEGGPVTAEATVSVEEIDEGLLPDKGGFVCGLTGDAAAPGVAPLVFLGLLALLRGRRRGKRR
jgi:uncharacterized cupredoxin-like copper-binding protein